MKILTIIGVFLCSMTHAADLIVEETGFDGAYTTISAAISAASSGDRILVFPKAGGAAYVENPTITLSNVQLLNAVEGLRFKVQGTISLGIGCIVIGAEVVSGNITDAGGLNSNTRIINCKIVSGNITASNYSKTWVDNDSVISGTISIWYGRISGCYIVATSGTGISLNTITYADSSVIVGNHIIAMNGISFMGSFGYFDISNNFIETTKDGIFISTSNWVTGPRFYCENNTIKATGSTLEFGIRVNNASSTINLRNTLIIASNSFTYAAYFCAWGFDAFRYNYYNGPGTAFSLSTIPTPDNTNIAASNSTINADGTLVAGSDAINGGDPGAQYLDLDLTRNDAGCYGGSYSLSNFTTSETGARVLFMKAPRTLFSTHPIIISGEGVDK
ncbi:MAG: hypothetical protein NTZ16_16250 [Verrucomicrobia bacterium]|nr:hypothetical protein [Verrucomicrobiota bacterium]